MLKTRVIPTLLYRGAGLVKGTAFDSWRPIGSAIQAVRVFNLREVDELVFLDIAATAEKRGPDCDLVEELSAACHMPLTVGGGIRDLESIRNLLMAGADKVVIGTAALEDPYLIERAADRFGAQCIVVALDCRGDELFTRCGRHPVGFDVGATAMTLEHLGAGELLVTAIDRDGTLAGYDLDLIRRVASSVRIPVIAAGGAGSGADCVAAVRAGASAVAAGAMFQFTQTTPADVKRCLVAAGIPARITTP